MNDLKGILILANTELDSCLAASLVIENINYIQGVKYKHPVPEDDEENEESDNEDNEDATDYLLESLLAKSYSEGSIISNLNTDLDICFCRQDLAVANALKITTGYAVIFSIGYDEEIVEKIFKTACTEDQEVMDLQSCFSTLLLSQIINWEARQDHWTNVRIAASIIWQQEYQNMAIDFPYQIGKKMRRQAEKIIDNYLDAWKIAYNLYYDDAEQFNLFYVEFMNQVANDLKSQFIKNLLELGPKLNERTQQAQTQITDQGHGIGLVKIGKKKLFKTDVLMSMGERGFCHRMIEYVDKNNETKTLVSDYHLNTFIVPGPFVKNEVIDKN
jgi:hypothetical protein